MDLITQLGLAALIIACAIGYTSLALPGTKASRSRPAPSLDIDIDIAHANGKVILTLTPAEPDIKPITLTLTPEQVPELVHHLIVELDLMEQENQS